ncbi:helix-turn-helix transcriptional regulator [Thermosyntropha sp.]|uniref:helix-turn-helix domain-containing protein n=1 Tax=Thermosyntropha sp. TaxID=2740820 RepID=UPI002600E445|nr:helix-turn-helix transcriptional regulator [Thermosyntropha sp.]MBO8158858.1 helix-turn-helix transcriptional regulator [Thermosyntropha sp.]
MNLNEKIKELRLQKNLTQEQLGKLIGVTTSMIGMYETGARKPSLEVLTKLANCFDVSIDYLLGREDELQINREEMFRDPDIRAIARAAQNMTSEQRKDLARFLQKAFNKAFEGKK